MNIDLRIKLKARELAGIINLQTFVKSQNMEPERAGRHCIDVVINFENVVYLIKHKSM